MTWLEVCLQLRVYFRRIIDRRGMGLWDGVGIIDEMLAYTMAIGLSRRN
jgi:hypothetical protein